MNRTRRFGAGCVFLLVTLMAPGKSLAGGPPDLDQVRAVLEQGMEECAQPEPVERAACWRGFAEQRAAAWHDQLEDDIVVCMDPREDCEWLPDPANDAKREIMVCYDDESCPPVIIIPMPEEVDAVAAELADQLCLFFDGERCGGSLKDSVWLDRLKCGAAAATIGGYGDKKGWWSVSPRQAAAVAAFCVMIK